MYTTTVGPGSYLISNKFYAASFFTREQKENLLNVPFEEVEAMLNQDIKLFYESSSPVVDGSILLGKSMLLHLLARIAQVFLDVIGGIFLIGLGVVFVVASPFVAERLQTFVGGLVAVALGLGLLTIAPVVDGVLAITSPLEGIYEATRVFFSPNSSSKCNN